MLPKNKPIISDTEIKNLAMFLGDYLNRNDYAIKTDEAKKLLKSELDKNNKKEEKDKPYIVTMVTYSTVPMLIIRDLGNKALIEIEYAYFHQDLKGMKKIRLKGISATKLVSMKNNSNKTVNESVDIMHKLSNVLYEASYNGTITVEEREELLQEAKDIVNNGDTSFTESSEFLDKLDYIMNPPEVTYRLIFHESDDKPIDVIFEYSRQEKKERGKKEVPSKEDTEFQKAFLDFKRRYHFKPDAVEINNSVENYQKKLDEYKKAYEKLPEDRKKEKKEDFEQKKKIHEDMIQKMKNQKGLDTSHGTIEVDGKRYRVNLTFNPHTISYNNGKYSEDKITTSAHISTRGDRIGNKYIDIEKRDILNKDTLDNTIRHEVGHLKNDLRFGVDVHPYYGADCTIFKGVDVSNITPENLSKMIYSKMLSIAKNDADYADKIRPRSVYWKQKRLHAELEKRNIDPNSKEVKRLLGKIFEEELKKECDEIAKDAIREYNNSSDKKDFILSASEEKDIQKKVKKKSLDLLVDRVSKKYSANDGHDKTTEYIADSIAYSKNNSNPDSSERKRYAKTKEVVDNDYEGTKQFYRTARRHTENKNKNDDSMTNKEKKEDNKDFKNTINDAMRDKSKEYGMKLTTPEAKWHKDETNKRMKNKHDKYSNYYAKKAFS